MRWLTLLVLCWPVLAGAQTSEAVTETDLECLALNIYWESRSEPEKGMQAVAHLTMNRVRHPEFPGSVCAVVQEGGEGGSCQFSWYCDGEPDTPTEEEAWQQAMAVARAALANPEADPTGGALYFHREDVSPDWASEKELVIQIASHRYYR